MALINDFMSLIYPRHCEACASTLFRHEQFICSYCRSSLPRSNYHLEPDNEITQLLAGRVPVIHASAFLLYEKRSRVQNLLHAIKYHDQKELAEFLGILCAREIGHAMDDVDVIVPVPLHRRKLKKRGFNQSDWFAKGLSAGLGKPVNSLALERITDTATQTKKKKYQRWENVEGIFRLKNPESMQNSHMLLVDDVITTGATIEAGWLALQVAPAAKISVLSIAFASRRN
jgi:ComF family protein